MLKKIIILKILIFINVLNAGDYNLHPSVKSILLPGWGESELKSKNRSKYFFVFEISLWTAFAGFYTFGNHKKKQYQSFAAQFAGVNPNYKNHKYWVDIGNYINLDEHNAEHLRWRSINDIYSFDNNWHWKSISHMKKFEKMRIESDMYAKYGEYILGVITLNHIISAINSLYLSRLNQNIQFKPNIGSNRAEIELILKI